MKVIVSKDLEDIYNNYVVVRNFKKVRELKGVTTLIIHNCEESEFDAGVFITEFHNSGISQFIYISSEPSFTIKMMIQGLNGYYFEDEFYLEDEEELDSLLEECGMANNEETTALATVNATVISDFIKAFARGEDRINAPVYLEQVNAALDSLVEQNNQQQVQITTMGQTAIGIFEKASTIMKNLNEQKIKIEKQLQELEDNQNSMPSRAPLGGGIQYFSPYRYNGNNKVLLIREYSPCRYLTSFTLGYLHHLHYNLNKRCKLVFVVQKGQNVMQKYNEFTMLSAESSGYGALYDNEILVTNNPVKEVMKNILEKPCDVFVIVDRLYGTQDIVSGRPIRLNAVSGFGDVARFKIKANETIFPVTTVPDGFVTIPTMKGFPIEQDSRYATYMQVMGEAYRKIDTKIGLMT